MLAKATEVEEVCKSADACPVTRRCLHADELLQVAAKLPLLCSVQAAAMLVMPAGLKGIGIACIMHDK